MLGAVLTAGVGALPYAAREPLADGRTLSEWLNLGRESIFERDNADVTNAVRKIGKKGIPVLLGKLRARDSVWKETLAKTSGERFFRDRRLSVDREHGEAIYGFSILGSQAVSALPELSKMLLDTNKCHRAGDALGVMGRDAFPVLRTALTNQNEAIRCSAAVGFTRTREGAPFAVPEILALRQHSNQWLAGAVLLCGATTLPEDDLLRVLTHYVRDPRWQGLLCPLGGYLCPHQHRRDCASRRPLSDQRGFQGARASYKRPRRNGSHNRRGAGREDECFCAKIISARRCRLPRLAVTRESSNSIAPKELKEHREENCLCDLCVLLRQIVLVSPTARSPRPNPRSS